MRHIQLRRMEGHIHCIVRVQILQRSESWTKQRVLCLLILRQALQIRLLCYRRRMRCRHLGGKHLRQSRTLVIESSVVSMGTWQKIMNRKHTATSTQVLPNKPTDTVRQARRNWSKIESGSRDWERRATKGKADARESIACNYKVSIE